MARLGLQRQAEAEIALEFGSDLGAISDGMPVVRDEHGSFVQGLHRADLAGVKSLNQRRDDAFGFSGERIGLGHQGLLSCWLSPCQWRAHGLSTASTSFPRVWPATPRSNACRAFASGIVSAITGRIVSESINAAILPSCSRSGRTMKNTPRLLPCSPCAAPSLSGIGPGKVTRIPVGFNTCQERSRVSPPMVSRTTSISRTASSN